MEGDWRPPGPGLSLYLDFEESDSFGLFTSKIERGVATQ